MSEEGQDKSTTETTEHQITSGYTLTEEEKQKWETIINAQPFNNKKLNWTDDLKEFFFQLVRKFHIVVEKGNKVKNFIKLASTLKMKGRGAINEQDSYLKGSYLCSKYVEITEEFIIKMKTKYHDFDPIKFIESNKTSSSSKTSNSTLYAGLAPWEIECIHAIAEETGSLSAQRSQTKQKKLLRRQSAAGDKSKNGKATAGGSAAGGSELMNASDDDADDMEAAAVEALVVAASSSSNQTSSKRSAPAARTADVSTTVATSSSNAGLVSNIQTADSAISILSTVDQQAVAPASKKLKLHHPPSATTRPTAATEVLDDEAITSPALLPPRKGEDAMITTQSRILNSTLKVKKQLKKQVQGFKKAVRELRKRCIAKGIDVSDLDLDSLLDEEVITDTE